jgi:RND superfamily putative drug exporter
METTLDRWGRTTARHPWITIVTWIVAIVALLGVSQASGGAFVNEFRVPGADSQKASDLAQEHFPEMGAVSADVVWHTDSGTLRDPAHASAIKAAVEQFTKLEGVRSADDPLAAGGAALSADGRTAISGVQYAADLQNLPAGAGTSLEEAAATARSTGLEVEFRGQVIDIGASPETGSAELYGVLAALIILLLAFGTVVAAGLPVIVAIAGLAAGLALVLIVGTTIDIPAIAPIVAVMLGLGAGIDYALFVVTRFRQGLAEGLVKEEAVGRALATAGHAVLFAGGTVVAAILGLLLTGIPFIGGMGVAAALTVVMTMLAALTLLPAILGLLGHRVNSLRIGRRRSKVATGPVTVPTQTLSRWSAWTAGIERHRYVYTAASVLVLLVLALPLLSLRMGTPDDGNNPEAWTQHKAYDTVSAAFGPGWNAPLLIVTETNGGDRGRATLERLDAGLKADPEVAAITPATPSRDGRVALLTVIPKHVPQNAEVADLMHRIRDKVAPAAAAGTSDKVYVGGVTAFNTDLADAVGERLPWMIAAVLAAAAVLLFAMFRAPLIAVKAVVMALFSIGAAFGVLVAIFQWGWGLSLVGLENPVPIMSMVPMLLFAVLFGLSMDYEVFMLTAVKEEYDASGDPQRAIQVGMAGVARVITAAAAIMTFVFLSFVPISDPVIKMIGVGLAAAVIVDVTVIRLVLAPAVLSIMGHSAWWGPGRRAAASPADRAGEVATSPEVELAEQS